MVVLETEKIRKSERASVPREIKNEENKKIKMGQHAKGRSQKQIGWRHVGSVRVGSDQVISCKGMKVRAYVHKYGKDAEKKSKKAGRGRSRSPAPGVEC